MGGQRTAHHPGRWQGQCQDPGSLHFPFPPPICHVKQHKIALHTGLEGYCTLLFHAACDILTGAGSEQDLF